MRNIIILVCMVLILFTLYKCESTIESNVDPEMDIELINIELIGVGIDTLLHSVPYVWIVKIDSNEKGFTANIDQIWDTANYLGLTDMSYYTSIEENGNLILFDKNEFVDNAENWVVPNNNSFNNFKGNGEKYMGYKMGISGQNETMFYYGWISVNYSATGDTLRIIELAKSMENDVKVKAGKK